jgi:hypothetical protein
MMTTSITTRIRKRRAAPAGSALAGRAGAVPGLAGLALAALALVALALAGPAAAETPAAPPAADSTKAASPADSTAAVSDTTAQPQQIIAYYFYTTKRCVSCHKIEAYSQEALETGFAEELKSGRLVWRPTNIDEPDNAHFVQDYQLYTKSLVLVDERVGKQQGWKNLADVWKLLNDKQKFIDYVQKETRAYLTAQQS